MKIAVVGGGIAGLAAAWLLKEAHEITLFECADYLGGHARTIPVDYGSTRVWAETGFKYLFPSTHPTVIALMRVLGISPRHCQSSITITRRGGETTGVLPPRTLREVSYLLRAPREVWHMYWLRRLLKQAGAVARGRDWTVSFRDHLRKGFPR